MSKLIKENTIGLIAHAREFQTKENIDKLYASLKGDFKRDWFDFIIGQSRLIRETWRNLFLVEK